MVKTVKKLKINRRISQLKREMLIDKLNVYKGIADNDCRTCNNRQCVMWKNRIKRDDLNDDDGA